MRTCHQTFFSFFLHRPAPASLATIVGWRGLQFIRTRIERESLTPYKGTGRFVEGGYARISSGCRYTTHSTWSMSPRVTDSKRTAARLRFSPSGCCFLAESSRLLLWERAGGPSPCPFSHSSPRSFRVFLFLAGWSMQVRFVAFSLRPRMSPCHERLSAERPALSIISFFSAILFDFSTWGYIAIMCDTDDDRNRSRDFFAVTYR